ncbi:hypothetical protein EV126DRAFT_222057 [Verticillium dahliae]|nr:hypothetical protein EV126DRAFT_164422 [Verticillium dahliae]KAH6702214.1 hypothetical protein EV126DRAFT_222057 [Verticillium dahliae]
MTAVGTWYLATLEPLFLSRGLSTTQTHGASETQVSHRSQDVGICNKAADRPSKLSSFSSAEEGQRDDPGSTPMHVTKEVCADQRRGETLRPSLIRRPSSTTPPKKPKAKGLDLRHRPAGKG